MFWFGLVFSAIVFLTGIQPIQDWVSSPWPNVNQKHLDFIRIVLFLLGLGISVQGHVVTENMVASLSQAIQPRNFTAGQDKVFLDVLCKAPPGKVQLLWLGSNPEAENLGKHIAVLLERAGWIVDKGGYGANPTPVGFEIHVQSEGNAPPPMATLREALKSVGYQISLVEKRDSPRNDWLWLVVGHKP
jgi:hypothetical protein